MSQPKNRQQDDDQIIILINKYFRTGVVTIIYHEKPKTRMVCETILSSGVGGLHMEIEEVLASHPSVLRGSL